MRRGPQKFHVSFDAAGITRFGGLFIFQQFCKSLGLRRFLQRQVIWPPYAERRFPPADLFLAHLFANVAGIGRVENTKALNLNGLFPHLLGLPDFPHRDTLRQFLWRFDAPMLRNLKAAHDLLRRELFQRMKLLWNAVVDMDATQLTVYGKQEAATVGYNKAHKGKASYSPLLTNEGRSGLSLALELRSGHEHSSTGALPLLIDSLDLLPKTIAATRTRVRAHAGFLDKDMVQALDGGGYGYVVSSRITGPLQSRLPGLRFHPFREDWAAADFLYQPTAWDNKHRFVAIRHRVQEEGPSSALFQNDGHDFRVLVTNLDLEPEAVWRFYTDRANQELLIRELKNAYDMAKIPTRSFFANAAYLEIALWAYDLVMAFKALCLPEAFQSWALATLRREFWSLPAQWVRTDNRNLLRLPPSFEYQDAFLRVQTKLPKIKPLI
jgi:hypothetical protein